MHLIKTVFTPDWKKGIVFVIFVMVTILGMIQRSPITETPPAPPTQKPIPFGDFNFTFLFFLLALPYYFIPLVLAFTRIFPLPHLPEWLVVAGNIVYLYILACLLASGFDRYHRKLSEWHWTAIFASSLIFIGVVLYRTHVPTSHLDDFLLYAAISLAMAIYVFIFVCVGFFIYDHFIKQKNSIE